MHKNKLLISGLVVLVMGAAILVFPSPTNAQSISAETTDLQDGWMGKRGGVFSNIDNQNEGSLAQALGISLEDLKAAKDSAWQKTIDQALQDRLITQAQAEMLQENNTGSKTFGVFHRWLIGGTDYNTKIADELGISVEELDAIRQERKDISILYKDLELSAGDVQANVTGRRS